jgi:hypothetical protein
MGGKFGAVSPFSGSIGASDQSYTEELLDYFE